MEGTRRPHALLIGTLPKNNVATPRGSMSPYSARAVCSLRLALAS
jgi:hypothetical protein